MPALRDFDIAGQRRVARARDLLNIVFHFSAIGYRGENCIENKQRVVNK